MALTEKLNLYCDFFSAIKMYNILDFFFHKMQNKQIFKVLIVRQIYM